MSVNIIFPVLNEKLRLEKGIVRTVEYLQSINCEDYRITIVDNGSMDETPQIARRLGRLYPRVTYKRIEVRGVGAAFRQGAKENSCSILGYMDIDLSTNLRHLGEALRMFEEDPNLQYINGSRFADTSKTKGRKWYRKITSGGLLVLLKVFLGMKSTDAICGFTFLRKDAAEELIAAGSDDNGWFYMIEFLLRAERRKMNILDYPVEWEEDYNTTVKIFRTVCNYIKNIGKLFWEFNIRKNI